MAKTPKDPWSRVPLKNGKLVGMLTETLAKAIFPSNTVKGTGPGLEVVMTKEGGRKMPSKAR